MRSLKTGRKTLSVALAVWHAVADILLFNFCEQKFVQLGPITIAIDCNGLYLLIFVLGASTFQCMHTGFLCSKCDNFACLHTRQDQNELHLKRWFFSFVCKSIAGPLPSVVQAYTQSYSFGGWIKLIICQIGHELSVTIHEISTSWKKKTLDGGPYTNVYNFLLVFLYSI